MMIYLYQNNFLNCQCLSLYESLCIWNYVRQTSKIMWQKIPFYQTFLMVRWLGQYGRPKHRYTPMAVVIDNHLPREPLISSYVPDWLTEHTMVIVSPLRRSVKLRDIIAFLVQVQLKLKYTPHPKFDLIRFQTHRLQITDNTFHVCEMLEPSGTLHMHTQSIYTNILEVNFVCIRLQTVSWRFLLTRWDVTLRRNLHETVCRRMQAN